MKMIVYLFLGVLLSLAAEAQTTITGRITDARTGESLIGASLVPKNSGELGAVTDIEGNFTLQTNVKLPLTLSVQYVGYRVSPRWIQKFSARQTLPWRVPCKEPWQD